MGVMFAVLGVQRAEPVQGWGGPTSKWCSTIQAAIAWANHTDKPVLAAGFGSFRGVGFLQDPSYDRVLSRFVPVEMKTYGDLWAVNKTLPPTGRPVVVILDKNRRLLKRMSGMVRPSDLVVVSEQITWLQRRGDSVLREVRGGHASGDVYADAATIYAMRGDTRQSLQLMTKAYAKHASPARLVPAWESLADEARVSESVEESGQLRNATRYYRAALALKPDSAQTARLRLRLASCLYRAGEMKEAYAEVRKVLDHPHSPEDVAYARLLLSRFESSIPPPSVARPVS